MLSWKRLVSILARPDGFCLALVLVSSATAAYLETSIYHTEYCVSSIPKASFYGIPPGYEIEGFDTCSNDTDVSGSFEYECFDNGTTRFFLDDITCKEENFTYDVVSEECYNGVKYNCMTEDGTLAGFTDMTVDAEFFSDDMCSTAIDASASYSRLEFMDLWGSTDGCASDPIFLLPNSSSDSSSTASFSSNFTNSNGSSSSSSFSKNLLDDILTEGALSTNMMPYCINGELAMAFYQKSDSDCTEEMLGAIQMPCVMMNTDEGDYATLTCTASPISGFALLTQGHASFCWPMVAAFATFAVASLI